jgi:hypothetical protein
MYYIPTFIIFFRLFSVNMKALLEIDRVIWGKVKDFATVNNISLSSAVRFLIISGLKTLHCSNLKAEETKNE